jgi:gas vesicle structural protein
MLLRQTTATNFIDLLDHVVDKGIVLDAWVALWSGISLVKSDVRIKIASVETYLPCATVPGVRTFPPLLCDPIKGS